MLNMTIISTYFLFSILPEAWCYLIREIDKIHYTHYWIWITIYTIISYHSTPKTENLVFSYSTCFFRIFLFIFKRVDIFLPLSFKWGNKGYMTSISQTLFYKKSKQPFYDNFSIIQISILNEKCSVICF